MHKHAVQASCACLCVCVRVCARAALCQKDIRELKSNVLKLRSRGSRAWPTSPWWRVRVSWRGLSKWKDEQGKRVGNGPRWCAGMPEEGEKQTRTYINDDGEEVTEVVFVEKTGSLEAAPVGQPDAGMLASAFCMKSWIHHITDMPARTSERACM